MKTEPGKNDSTNTIRVELSQAENGGDCTAGANAGVIADSATPGWRDGPGQFPVLLLALVLSCLQACAAPSPVTQHDTQVPHALTGQIWDTGNAEFIGPGQLISATAQVDYLLLGEVHDNAQHHDWQAQLVAGFAGPPQSVLVGFEQLVDSQAGPLAQYLKAHPDDAAGLGAAVDWDKSGWPDWTLYQPIFQQALDRGWQPVPLMFSADKSMAILDQGYSAVLGEDALAILQPANALDSEEQTEVEALMHASHCGKLPASMLPGMVTIQTAKDAYMAWEQAVSGRRGILIVGDGHARKDRGIPLFLQRVIPEAVVAVVSMVEVEPGLTAPADYPQSLLSHSDFVVFTTRQERGDPCAAIAQASNLESK